MERPTGLQSLFYPLAQSEALRDAPLERTLDGRRLVLFRDARGGARAVDAACPHRGANLADGRVVDGCLECPYHGWRFAGDGHCVFVPSQPGREIPSRSTARTHEVIEQQGIIWVRVGDVPALAPPPSFPAADDPSMRRFAIETVMDGPFDWWLDNYMDFSHVPFLHRDSFGGQNPEVEVHPLERREDELGFRARLVARYDYKLLTRLVHGSLRPYREDLRFDVTLPGAVYIDIDLGHGRRQALALLAAPETTTTTRVIQVVWRNYLTWVPFGDAIGRAFTRRILREDGQIVRRCISTERLPGQAVMAADRPGQELWRLLRLWRARQADHDAPTEAHG